MEFLTNIISGTINVLIPPLCPICNEDTAMEDFGCCSYCSEKILQIDLSCNICCVPINKVFGQSAETSVNTVSFTCGDCLKNKKHFKMSRSAVEYLSVAREAILSYKYNSGFHVERLLSNILSKRAVLFQEEVGVKFDTIMPVPLHRVRLKDRGYNQSLILAKAVSKVINTPVDCFSLVRIKDTTPQVELKLKAREENVKGAFGLLDGGLLKGKKILLIDDVYTTGATINECSKVLSKAGAEVYGLTVARAVAQN